MKLSLEATIRGAERTNSSVPQSFSDARKLVRPIILTVSGASASGKSRLATELIRDFESLALSAIVIGGDPYYSDLTHLPQEERDNTNFDDPASQDQAALRSDFQKILQGLEIEVHNYCYTSKSRKPTGEFINSGAHSIVIFEGIFVNYYSVNGAIIPDFSVHLDVPLDQCLERRKYRDLERGYDADDVLRRWPMVVEGYDKFTVGPLVRMNNVLRLANSTLEDLNQAREIVVDKVKSLLLERLV